MLEILKSILEKLRALDLSDAAAARETLARAFPLDSELVRKIRDLFARGVEDGSLCGQGGGSARFSRVAKSSPETHGFSVDAVRLSGPGVWHRHTGGEVDLCFARSESARFDGHPEGWVVFAPGSDHVPTVTGGEMDILNFIPGGALQWKRE
ncbi:MAG: DUF4863 family protein [Deltaproteobacteria bacterium]|nr:DUF4863 family protein [Deltaproteobacteria bacterium]